MAFPNVSDIVATTIEQRGKKIRDNVAKNNALLMRLENKGKKRTVSGGSVILEELSFAENPNAGWYSGYDLLPVNTGDVISAAQFDLKQAAVPVVISGLEQLQNAGKEQMIDLMGARLQVAEKTMMNLVAQGIYSDGTGAGGKQITGLNAAVSTTPTTGVYGGIDRATWVFWRHQYTLLGSAATAATIQGSMNAMWASLVRGVDRPDLIIADNFMWTTYLASLQAQQRFVTAEGGDTANLGYQTIKYMDADVVLDGGIGGFVTSKTMFFLNTDYLYWRPHAERDMVPLNPKSRFAINQDAEVQILAFAGNLTCSGAQFQGRLVSP